MQPRCNKVDEALSNKALSILITVSLLIAVSGIFLAVRPGLLTITGMPARATNDQETAVANVTIVSNVAITVQGGWDFGEGFVIEGNGTAMLRSSGRASGDPETPFGYLKINWTATLNATNGSVRVSNVGNVNVSLRAGANASAYEWYCKGAQLSNSQEINTTGGPSGTLPCETFMQQLIDVNSTPALLNSSFGTLLCRNDSLGVTETINPHLQIRIDELCEAEGIDRYITVSFFAWNNITGGAEPPE
ncbi:hypothetical protein HYS48_02330 [Candidatus Woesearchaeota archaeon]|nr:hypothetical protein [Candidatus Woesearchaeota archaeon]